MSITRGLVLSVLASFLSGCSALVVPTDHPAAAPIAVSIRGSFASVAAGSQPVTITASVQNDRSRAAVTWLLTAGGTPCSPTCGLISPAASPSLTATYTPPSSVPDASSSSPSITAQSVADNTKSASFSFTITPAASSSLSITGEFASVMTAAPPISLNAVTNDPQGVTWSLTANGANCTPLCGTLDFSSGQHLLAVYTPPPLLAATASSTATITATAVTDSTKSASFSFTIQRAASTNYALFLRGYHSNGVPMAIAGVLVTDVAGNINDGELDINTGGHATRMQAVRGNFGTTTDFAGIIRGTITITNFTFPDSFVNPSFEFVLRGSLLEGRLIEFDGSGNLVAGTLLLQSGVSANVPGGVYAFGLDSDAPLGMREIAAGAFAISQTGSIDGVMDQSQAGAPAPVTAAVLSGSVIAPDSLGRGTLSFSVAGTPTQYAYYFVNPNQLNLVQVSEDSSATVLAGTARARAASFDVNNGAFQTSVFQLTGVQSSQPPNVFAPDVAIGILATAKNNSASLNYDANNAGIVTLNQKLSTSLLSYDPNTARGVLAVSGGLQNGIVDTAVFYLYDNGEGYVVESDPSVAGGLANKAFSGSLVRQIPGSFSAQSLSGPMINISGASSTPAIPNVVAAVTADPVATSLTGAAFATSLQAGQLSDVSFIGTYILSDPATGRATATLPGGFYGDFTSYLTLPASLYLIGPNRFVTIGTQAGTPSGVSYFSPD